jgi:hypothetical protein
VQIQFFQFATGRQQVAYLRGSQPGERVAEQPHITRATQKLEQPTTAGDHELMRNKQPDAPPPLGANRTDQSNGFADGQKQ